MNVDHPLPVDDGDTLFQFGSTGKTLTATAIMVFVGKALLELDAPGRTCLADLTLTDGDVGPKVTDLQLLHHTAGWTADVFEDTGEGDDVLAKHVSYMAPLCRLLVLEVGVTDSRV